MLTDETASLDGRTEEEMLETRKKELVGRRVVGILRKHQSRYFVIWHANKYAGVHISGKNVVTCLGPECKDGEIVVCRIAGLGPGFQKWNKQHPFAKECHRATHPKDIHRLGWKFRSYSRKLLSGQIAYDPKTGRTVQNTIQNVKTAARNRAQSVPTDSQNPLAPLSEEKVMKPRAFTSVSPQPKPAKRRVIGAGRWTRARSNGSIAEESLPPMSKTRTMSRTRGGSVGSRDSQPRSRSRSGSGDSSKADNVAFYKEKERGRGENAMRWRSNSVETPKLTRFTKPVIPRPRSSQSLASLGSRKVPKEYVSNGGAKIAFTGSKSAPSIDDVAKPEDLPSVTKRGAVVTYNGAGENRSRTSSSAVVVAPLGEDRTTVRGCKINIVGGGNGEKRTRKDSVNIKDQVAPKARAYPGSKSGRPIEEFMSEQIPTIRAGSYRSRSRAQTKESKPAIAPPKGKGFTNSEAMEARNARVLARQVSQTSDRPRTLSASSVTSERITNPKAKYVEALSSGCTVTYTGVVARPSPFPVELAAKLYGTTYNIVG
jgi:hypothetical protein